MHMVLKRYRCQYKQKRRCISLFVFLILYVSNDTFLFGTNNSSLMVSIPRYLSLIGVFVLLFSNISRGKLHLKRNELTVLLIFGFFQFANYILGGSTIQIVIVQLVFILFAFFIALTIDREFFWEIYIEVITIFAVASILIFIVNVFAPGVLRCFPSVANTSGTVVNYVILGVADASSSIIRSRGIFWEPGTYAIYLLLAIFFTLFSKEIRIKRVIILVTALLLTFSTAGYISLAYLLFMWMLSRNVSNSIKGKFFLISIMILLIVSPFLGSVIEEMFINKFAGGILGSTHGSTVSRLASFVLNGEIAFENPVFGVGLTDIDSIFIEKTIDFFGYANRSDANANTVMFKFAAHGLIYGSVLVLGIWKMFCKISKSRSVLVKMLLLGFVFLLFAGENLQNSILPYLLVFYGISLEKAHFKNRNNEVISNVY